MGFKGRASLLLLSAFIAACSSHEGAGSADHDIPVVMVRETGSDIRIPTFAWEKLAQGGGKVKPKSDAEGLTLSPIAYGSLMVTLKEKNKGVLKEPVVRLQMPDGGGEIDLAKWVTGQTGTFFVDFEIEGSGLAAEERKVLFYSRARKRRVGDETVGSGCRQVLDVTKLVESHRGEGIPLNTTRNFHTSVIGGHFLFSWLKDGFRKVSRVTFTDSSNPMLFCESEK